MRVARTLLFAVGLVGLLVELSCLAGERSHVPPSAAPAALFRAVPTADSPTVDPPSVSEVDADEIPEMAVSSALTR